MRKEDNGWAALLSTDDNGARVYGHPFFRHPWYMRDVPCQDCGRRHTVRLNQDADTMFSWPGRAYCQGKTRRGFVTHDEDKGGDIFHLYHYQEESK